MQSYSEAPQRASFWARTTADGETGVSVRHHCLKVGYVAEALHELSVPLRGDTATSRTFLGAAKEVIQRNCQTGLVLINGFLGQSIQWTARARILFDLLVPSLILPAIEPFRQPPKLFSRQLVDGCLDFRRCFHDGIIRRIGGPLNSELT